MPNWVPVLVTVVIAVLTIVVNAVVNTTIKFAPDAATARQELKRLGNKTLRRLLDAAMVASVIYNVAMPGPVTSVRVFTISLGVGALVYAVATSQMIRALDGVWKAVHQLGESQHEIVKTMDRHLTFTERIADKADRTS